MFYYFSQGEFLQGLRELVAIPSEHKSLTFNGNHHQRNMGVGNRNTLFDLH